MSLNETIVQAAVILAESPSPWYVIILAIIGIVSLISAGIEKGKQTILMAIEIIFFTGLITGRVIKRIWRRRNDNRSRHRNIHRR